MFFCCVFSLELLYLLEMFHKNLIRILRFENDTWDPTRADIHRTQFEPKAIHLIRIYSLIDISNVVREYASSMLLPKVEFHTEFKDSNSKLLSLNFFLQCKPLILSNTQNYQIICFLLSHFAMKCTHSCSHLCLVF